MIKINYQQFENLIQLPNYMNTQTRMAITLLAEMQGKESLELYSNYLENGNDNYLGALVRQLDPVGRKIREQKMSDKLYKFYKNFMEDVNVFMAKMLRFMKLNKLSLQRSKNKKGQQYDYKLLVCDQGHHDNAVVDFNLYIESLQSKTLNLQSAPISLQYEVTKIDLIEHQSANNQGLQDNFDYFDTSFKQSIFQGQQVDDADYTHQKFEVIYDNITTYSVNDENVSSLESNDYYDFNVFVEDKNDHFNYMGLINEMYNITYKPFVPYCMDVKEKEDPYKLFLELENYELPRLKYTDGPVFITSISDEDALKFGILSNLKKVIEIVFIFFKDRHTYHMFVQKRLDFFNSRVAFHLTQIIPNEMKRIPASLNVILEKFELLSTIVKITDRNFIT